MRRMYHSVVLRHGVMLKALFVLTALAAAALAGGAGGWFDP